jgi:glyoxylase-like metal-dependent hydrolase (beta-lactamase superfamily II)
MRNKISEQESATTKITAKRVVLWAFGGLLALIVFASAGLMPTFTPAKLKTPAVEVGELPPASPPVGMSVSILPTGTYQSRAALAFRGGSWSDIRQFTMTALLVRHPKGNLLIDTGAGKNVDAHVKIMPAMMRATTDYTKAIPAHWDHISGVDDLPGVPVLVTAEGKAFIDSKKEGTEVINSIPNVNYTQYTFDGGPYLGFPRSHDVGGDGSVVIVPAPGHTPDSVVVFVNLPSGTRYAMIGDLTFQLEGLEIPAEKPWMLRHLIGENNEEVHKDIALIRTITQKYPQVHPIPAHDVSAFRSIPVFPASIR